MDHNPTSALMKMLGQTDNIESFIDAYEHDLAVQPFHVLVTGMAHERNVTVAQIIDRACMNESYCYQLFKGTRRPSRDKIIQLAFGMGLNLGDTNRLLRAAEKSELYCRNKRDAVIMFGLNNRKGILDIEAILLAKGCDLLIECL